MVRAKFETYIYMNIVSIILIINRDIWPTMKAVIMVSGFFVLKVVFKMKTRGIYVSALVKKRLYWPIGVHIDVMN